MALDWSLRTENLSLIVANPNSRRTLVLLYTAKLNVVPQKRGVYYHLHITCLHL